jgi:hypothetical protein
MELLPFSNEACVVRGTSGVVQAMIIPVNELAMNLASEVVNDRYFKVLIVAQAVVAKFLCNDAAVGNRFGVGIKINPDPVSHRGTPPFISKKNFCIIVPLRTNPAHQESFRTLD